MLQSGLDFPVRVLKIQSFHTLILLVLFILAALVDNFNSKSTYFGIRCDIYSYSVEFYLLCGHKQVIFLVCFLKFLFANGTKNSYLLGELWVINAMACVKYSGTSTHKINSFHDSGEDNHVCVQGPVWGSLLEAILSSISVCQPNCSWTDVFNNCDIIVMIVIS